MDNKAYALKMQGITKRFPGTLANDHITIECEHGKVLGLLGENGAGKTTLMNILYGLFRPDEGQIFIDGEEVEIQSPSDAINHGIGMVHQHFKLVDTLTVIENNWQSTRITVSESSVMGSVSGLPSVSVNDTPLLAPSSSAVGKGICKFRLPYLSIICRPVDSWMNNAA